MGRLRRMMSLMRHPTLVKMALSNAIRIADGDATAMLLGGLSDDEIAALIRWLPDTGTFVEFGTLFGLTAKAIAAAKPDLKIVAVDNFSWNPFGLPPRIHEEFTRRILSSEIAAGRIQVLNADSKAFRDGCTVAPSAVFFDALHQYEPVKEEILWAKQMKVRLIMGHDYGNPSPVFGVTRAVDEEFPQGVDVVGMCWRGRS